MSQAEATQSLQDHESVMTKRFVTAPDKAWQLAWNWLSERTNPIVVKEARQSLNSNQFTICFSVTLAAIAIWTALSIMNQLPNAYYLPSGLLVATGYFVILGFPLIVVIPFSAFRSMLSEIESRTFELLSISALSASQIVWGKMASALLQIVIYLSAIMPCVVITYLLRGISMQAILLQLYFSVLLSIGITALNIFLATIARYRLLQIFANIFVLVCQLLALLIFSVATYELLFETVWMYLASYSAVLGTGSIVLGAIPFILRSAAAAVDFPSENHAVAIRGYFFLWIGVIVFWLSYLLILQDDVAVCVVSYYWLLSIFLFLGAITVSERGILSPRAQRSLPKTFVGRALFTWFYPGAGMGYVFLTLLFASIVVVWSLFGHFYSIYSPGFQKIYVVMLVGVVSLCYFAFFTGITRLIMLLVPRTQPGRWVNSLLIQLGAVGIFSGVPYFVVSALNDFRPFDFGWHQALAVPWCLDEMSSVNIDPITRAVTIIINLILAGGVFLLNLCLCGRDVLLIRVALPPRVETEIQKKQASPTEPVIDPLA